MEIDHCSYFGWSYRGAYAKKKTFDIAKTWVRKANCHADVQVLPLHANDQRASTQHKASNLLISYDREHDSTKTQWSHNPLRAFAWLRRKARATNRPCLPPSVTDLVLRSTEVRNAEANREALLNANVTARNTDRNCNVWIVIQPRDTWNSSD